jgi:membrane protease YdiL (CAAX protease family)
MPDPNYAGFWRRCLASLLDNAVWLLFLSFIYSLILEGAFAVSDALGLLATLVFLSLWFNYFAFCEWRWGQTIGKNATGIEVRSIDGADQLTYGQASIRNLLRIVDFFVIGEVMIAAGKRRQRLGDKAAKTVVLRRAPRGAMAPIRGGAEPIAAETAAEETPSPEEGSRRGLLPEIDWGPRQAFLGLLAALLLSAFLPAIFVAPFDPDLSGTGSLIAAQFLLGASLVAVPIAIATHWKWRRWRDALPMFGFRRFRASAFQLAALAWFTYFIASAVYAAIVVEPKQEDVGGQLGVGDANLVIAITAVALVAVVGPMWEELFFRGFLFSGLRQGWSFWPAALVSGFLFGLVHAPEGITIVVPLGILGTALAWLYQRTGSLWPCIGIHWFNNALALALAPLLGNSTLHALI